MTRIVECFIVGNYTVLILSNIIKATDKVVIDDTEYKVEIVYDIPNAISIAGKHDFADKEIRFI